MKTKNNFRLKTLPLIIIFAISIVVVGVAAAQSGTPASGIDAEILGPDTPQGTAAYLTFQGRLTTPDGSPINTPVKVTFRIYTDVDPTVAPTAIWTSAERDITPVNGLFTVYLGDGDDPSLTDPVARQAAAISIQVAPDPEMTPRQPLNSVVGYGSYAGVYGGSTSGYGVYGYSSTNTGVYGYTSTGTAVTGYAQNSRAGYFNGAASCCTSAAVRVINYGSAVGLWATTNGNNAGVFGQGNASGVVGEVTANGGIGVQGRLGQGVTSGYAGQFLGNVQVTGNLSKGGGSFKIDHPLDPANKYLYHSFVESPDMMNIYNGNATTDANGEAVIQLPDWFEALNQDFRYQLTPIGQFAQVIVLHEIASNQFTIKTDQPHVKVSWQVTGIRHDPYAETYRIPVEEDKPADERGKYLHPELYGQPEYQAIGYEMRSFAVDAPEQLNPREMSR